MGIPKISLSLALLILHILLPPLFLLNLDMRLLVTAGEHRTITFLSYRAVQ